MHTHTLLHTVHNIIFVYVLATEVVGLALAVLLLSPVSDEASVSVQASSDAGVSTFFLTSLIRWPTMYTGQLLYMYYNTTLTTWLCFLLPF